MTTPATILAYKRERPGTTRQYTAHMRKKVRTATGGDGAEYPPQLPMMVMPYGRGRDRAALIHWVASTRTKKLPRKTNRCRQRRKIMVSTTTDSPITVAPQPVPPAL